jgi:hypothetical protein
VPLGLGPSLSRSVLPANAARRPASRSMRECRGPNGPVATLSLRGIRTTWSSKSTVCGTRVGHDPEECGEREDASLHRARGSIPIPDRTRDAKSRSGSDTPGALHSVSRVERALQPSWPRRQTDRAPCRVSGRHRAVKPTASASSRAPEIWSRLACSLPEHEAHLLEPPATKTGPFSSQIESHIESGVVGLDVVAER